MKKFLCIFTLALALVAVWYRTTDDIDFIIDPILDKVKSILNIDSITNKTSDDIFTDSEGGQIIMYKKDKKVEFKDVSYYNTSLFAEGTYEIGNNGDYIITINAVQTEYYKELIGTKLTINQPDVATINAFGTTYKKD